MLYIELQTVFEYSFAVDLVDHKPVNVWDINRCWLCFVFEPISYNNPILTHWNGTWSYDIKSSNGRFPALLAIFAENSAATSEFPPQRASNADFDVSWIAYTVKQTVELPVI